MGLNLCFKEWWPSGLKSLGSSLWASASSFENIWFLGMSRSVAAQMTNWRFWFLKMYVFCYQLVSCTKLWNKNHLIIALLERSTWHSPFIWAEILKECSGQSDGLCLLFVQLAPGLKLPQPQRGGGDLVWDWVPAGLWVERRWPGGFTWHARFLSCQPIVSGGSESALWLHCLSLKVVNHRGHSRSTVASINK